MHSRFLKDKKYQIIGLLVVFIIVVTLIYCFTENVGHKLSDCINLFNGFALIGVSIHIFHLGNQKDKNNSTISRKKQIFDTLLENRYSRTKEHVESAISKIQKEFHKSRDIQDILGKYWQHLNTPYPANYKGNDEQIKFWNNKEEQLFVDLLYAISRDKDLDYEYHRDDIYYYKAYTSSKTFNSSTIQYSNPILLNYLLNKVIDGNLSINQKVSIICPKCKEIREKETPINVGIEESHIDVGSTKT